jgi:hypothetical protein
MNFFESHYCGYFRILPQHYEKNLIHVPQQKKSAIALSYLAYLDSSYEENFDVTAVNYDELQTDSFLFNLS